MEPGDKLARNEEEEEEKSKVPGFAWLISDPDMACLLLWNLISALLEIIQISNGK